MSTTATSAADFTWNPSLGIRILTQLFCIGAIELCCERQLALWTAINQASPPTTVVKTAPKPPVPRTWQQRWKNNAINIGMMIMPVPGLLGAFKKGALIPHYLIDGLWLGIMMWMWTKGFASALYGIFPRARSIHRLRRNNDAKNWDFDVETVGPTSGFRWTNPHVGLFAGFLCSALLLTSSYFGSTDLLPLACAAQIISALASWYAPQFKMKVLVMLQAGVILLSALVCGIVFLVGTGKKSSPQEMAEFAKGYPAPWLLRIMAVVSFNLIYSIPGAFMQVNMRYEHSRVAPAPTPSAPGEPVLVNHKAAVPALPLYRSTIFALIACCLIDDAWSYYTSSENFSVDQLLLLLIAIPAIVGGTAVYTFFRGDFKDWWNYSEKYRPEIDMETVKEVDEDGKEVGAETADEKRPITP